MIFEKAAQSLVWHRIERIRRSIDYVVYSILKIGGINVIDRDKYEYGLNLLERLLEVLPEEITRQDTIENIEEAVYALREAVKDEA